MKTIGLIGGLSWHSTIDYYRIINTEIHNRLGKQHSAKILLSSVNFQDFSDAWSDPSRQKNSAILCSAAQSLQKGGADFFLMCSNTPHRFVPEVTASVSIPLISISDAVTKHAKKNGLRKLGLMGTTYTIGGTFYSESSAKQGIEIVVPDQADWPQMHDLIYSELTQGIFTETTRAIFLNHAKKLVALGADGIAMACTEIPILLAGQDFTVPLLDTTRIHAMAAVDAAFT